MTSTKTILALALGAVVLAAINVPTAAFAHGGGMGGSSHMGQNMGQNMGMQNNGPAQNGDQVGHTDQHVDHDDRHTRRDDRHRGQTKNLPVDTFHVFLTDLHKFVQKLRMEGFRVVKITRVIVNGNAVADISAVKIGGSTNTAGTL